MDWEIKFIFDYCSSPPLYYTYQHYFLMGFRSIGVSIDYSPQRNYALSLAFERRLPFAARIWRHSAHSKNVRHVSESENYVGRYLFKNKCTREEVKVAIDASDGSHVAKSEVLSWADIYFKTNKWPLLSYPKKVKPLVTGNGYLTKKSIDFLKSLRSVRREYDVVYWAKIWDTEDPKVDTSNLREHQLRLFETLARVDGKKNLLAVLLPANKPFESEIRGRLKKAKVPVQCGWKGINSQCFWRNLANSKVVFYRAGNHLCTSWRITDLLCMGACVILDGKPHAEWPRALSASSNFVDGGCRLSNDYALPLWNRYECLKRIIEQTLERPDEIRRIRRNNQQYFDCYG